jgi:hypothetical protein
LNWLVDGANFEYFVLSMSLNLSLNRLVIPGDNFVPWFAISHLAPDAGKVATNTF